MPIKARFIKYINLALKKMPLYVFLYYVGKDKNLIHVLIINYLLDLIKEMGKIIFKKK
jgi:hypothetical protein